MGRMHVGRPRASPRARRPFSTPPVFIAIVLLGLVLAVLLPWPSDAGGASDPGAGADAPGAAGDAGGAGAIVAAAGAQGTATATGRVDAAPDGVVTVLVAPTGSGRVAAGADLTATVQLVNRTADELPEGELVLSMQASSIDSRSEFGRWLAAASGSARGDVGTDVARVSTPRVAVGDTVELHVTAAAAGLPVTEGGSFEPRGLAARLLLGGAETAQGRSSIVVDGTADALPTPLSIVVPIVPPNAAAPRLTADDLAGLTASDGALTRLLEAVDGTRATLAIDPRLLLSIRALGDAAPASATQWLARLEALPNDSFALPYADADLTLQRQAGLDQPLALGSLDFALGPEPAEPAGPTDAPDATGGASTGAPDASGGPADTGAASTTVAPGDTAAPGATDGTEPPTASPSPGPDEPAARPTLEELTAFPYTLDAVAWPSAGTLGAADLDALLQWGYRGVIVDAASVERLDDTYYTPEAQVELDGWSAVAADDQLSSALALAASAASPADLDAAVAELSTTLAIVARELPYEPRTMLATTGHAAASDPDSLGAALRAIDALPWAEPAGLTIPDLAGDPAGAMLREGAQHDPAVLDRVHELFAAERRSGEVATMFDEPETYRSEQRAGLLGMLSAAWHERLVDWAAVSQTYVDGVTAVDASVALIESSEIQLVGRESQLPIFVNNGTDRPVTVQVSLEPTTGRLEVGEPVTVRVEPGSMARAQVPVTAISNGFATVDVRIETPDGVPLLSSMVLRVNVQAEWETVGIVVLAVGVGALLVAGIVRTVRRRRRERVDRPSLGGASVDEG